MADRQIQEHTTTKILIVDDDPELFDLLTQIIQRKGFDLFYALNGREALHIAYKVHPNLIILDLMMPEMDGWDFCYRLRQIADTPILVLTALTDKKSQMHCLELGADDVMTKPFSTKELELRVMALLRRTTRPSSPFTFDNGKLVVDLHRCRVLKNGQEVRLSATEFRLLSYLACHSGQVISHERLIESIWGHNQIGKISSLGLYIHKLRQKLEDDPAHPRYILNKWGSGYQFTALDESHPPALVDTPIR